MKFFLANIHETLEILGTSAKGLQQMEAEQRLITYGKNELVEKKKKPAWLLFLAQFKELMTLILLLAAIVSWAIGDAKDAAIILVIHNAGIERYKAIPVRIGLQSHATIWFRFCNHHSFFNSI